MNLTSFKLLIWVASLGVLGYLGYFIYQWAVEGGRHTWTATRAPSELMQRVLDDVPEPEPPRVALVDYERVVATFRELNWTGREAPPPPPPPPPPTAEPVTKQAPDVAKLLRVLYVEVDTDSPALSVALVAYENADLVRRHKDPLALRVGDRLHEPHRAVRVHAILGDGVEFAVDDFDDEPPQRVPTWSNWSAGIVVVGEGGAILPQVAAIPMASPRVVGRPQRTIERRPNTFVLGSDDMERFGQDYLEILGNEVRHRQYRNPRTGQWGGVEILEVPEGSIVAQHGVKSGDVVKSINGNPVNSVSEAISYVKNNSELYTVWEVVVENAGKQRTLVFESK